MPEILTNQNTTYVHLKDEELKDLMEKRMKEGKIQMPLPSIVEKDGINVRKAITVEQGNGIIIYANPEQFTNEIIPLVVTAPVSGNLIVIAGDSDTVTDCVIIDKEGRVWEVTFPSVSFEKEKSGLLKRGMKRPVEMGEKLAERDIKIRKDIKEHDSYSNFLNPGGNYNLKNGDLLVIRVADNETKKVRFMEGILTTDSGEVVVTGQKPEAKPQQVSQPTPLASQGK